MFDGLFEVIAKTLSVFYDLIPNYAVAIALLTIVVMVVTTPFTLKGTRSMIQMQRLQPEMKKLQIQYKDDRQKLNEELMAFYKENSLNPLGGCLPLLLQTPIFILLYQVIQGLFALGLLLLFQFFRIFFALLCRQFELAPFTLDRFGLLTLQCDLCVSHLGQWRDGG